MRLLVLGCNGMVGHTVSLYMKTRGYNITGFSRQKSDIVPTIIGNAMDSKILSHVIKKGRYDSVINCIGILNEHAETNKPEAVYLNSYLPHLLAEVTSGSDTQVIHLSTDCVFSGERGQYTEDDFPDGLSFYDRSKAIGELEDNKNLTLRNSVVGPDMNSKGIGLLNWFMQVQGEVYGYRRVMWTGQTTLQLAKTMEAASLKKAHGLYNMVPDYAVSKHELLVLFNHYLRNDLIRIVPMDMKISDKSLKRTRFDFDYIVPSYEQMVSEMAQWICQYKQYYPHYCL